MVSDNCYNNTLLADSECLLDRSESAAVTVISTLERKAIPELLGKNFFIPDYQRGYRWEEKQILQLLEDIHNFFESQGNASFYCLQPIVVKKCSQEVIEKYKLTSELDNNTWYEVIDGQQRLTTLRIFLSFYFASSFMDDRLPYKLAYATRPSLGAFFDGLELDLKKKTFFFRNSDGLDRNVDRRYIEKCVTTVYDCFNHDKGWQPGESFHLQYGDLVVFFKNLLNDAQKKSVQVLWYETCEKKDARIIFERINDLKIPLSNSELIRALFLSEEAVYPYENANPDLKPHEKTALQLQDKRSKQRYINARWDEIEHRLRNEDFWAFITNRSATNTRNRIEILFDLISQKYVKGPNPQAPTLNKDDSQYTYLYFDLLIKEKRTDLWDLWKRVQAYYSRLCFWFENNDYYHRIGYLIYLQHSGDQILTDLLTSAEGKKKGEFEEDLTARIKSTLPEQSKINELDYQKNADGILKILLLHNIESSRCNEAAGRFPFALFKKKGTEQNWTIEHIHAQNSECLGANDKDTWLAWAKINEAVLRENRLFEERDKTLLDDLKNAISSMESNDSKFTHDRIVSLFDRVSNIYSTGSIPVLHQLSNLTLLDGSINSGIGNSVFEVKRQYISKCDADGDYIPYCTRRVFLKYYYDKEKQDASRLNQPTFTWGAEDRKNYLEDIKTKLSPYLSGSFFSVKEV